MIPFLDLSAAYQELKSEIDAAVLKVLDSGCYILGNEVEEFEREWASYCAARHSITVANGLDALTIALKVIGIGQGDSVIVPSNTYIATWFAISAVGAELIPVEPDPITYNIDPSRIERAIKANTKAIIPVHLYGQPANLDPIITIAKQYRIAIIEDAAQAHGARYKGRRIGAHGDLVCWSFYPGKNLGALGDGGAITTNNSDLAEKIRIYRNYGSPTKYVHELQGTNSRLDPIQAAVLRTKLPYLDEWNKRRSELASFYQTNLADLNLKLPEVPDWAQPSWHLYVVRSKQRNLLQARLKKQNIDTLIHYPTPPHMQAAYGNLGLAPERLPIARNIADEVLSLPIGPHLTQQKASIVAEKIRQTMAIGDV